MVPTIYSETIQPSLFIIFLAISLFWYGYILSNPFPITAIALPDVLFTEFSFSTPKWELTSIPNARPLIVWILFLDKKPPICLAIFIP